MIHGIVITVCCNNDNTHTIRVITFVLLLVHFSFRFSQLFQRRQREKKVQRENRRRRRDRQKERLKETKRKKRGKENEEEINIKKDERTSRRPFKAV